MDNIITKREKEFEKLIDKICDLEITAMSESDILKLKSFNRETANLIIEEIEKWAKENINHFEIWKSLESYLSTLKK